MPQGNFTIHFGVLPEHLEEVVPGVGGLDTQTDGDSWHAWGIPVLAANGYRDLAQHIQVHTEAPLATLPRILTHYGPLLLASQYEQDRHRNGGLVLVTNRYDQGQRNYIGTFALYAGEQQPSDYVLQLNSTQGASRLVDDVF